MGFFFFRFAILCSEGRWRRIVEALPEFLLKKAEKKSNLSQKISRNVVTPTNNHGKNIRRRIAWKSTIPGGWREITSQGVKKKKKTKKRKRKKERKKRKFSELLWRK